MKYWPNIIYSLLAILTPIGFASEFVGTDLVSKYESEPGWIEVGEPENRASKEVCIMPTPSSQLEVGDMTTLQDGRYQIDAAGMEGAFRGHVKLFGGVKIQQDQRSIFAPTIDLEMDSGVADFGQGIEIISPQFLLNGDTARLETDKSFLHVNNPQIFFKESGIRLHSESMSQKANGDLILFKASVSTCASSSESWSLTTSRMKIDEDAKKAIARNLILRLKGIPILYTPFLPMPMGSQEKGGFSFPSVGFSSEDGVELGVPYEFNWSDGNSLSLTPRLISKRGVGLKAKANFTEVWHQTEIAGGYVHRDRLFDGNLTKEEYYRNREGLELSGFEGVDRWSGRVSHQGRFGFFETEVDHNFISDEDYFRDVSSSYSGVDREALSQYARLGFSYHELNVNVVARDFEIVDPISSPGYRLQPEFSIDYETQLPGAIDMNLSYRSTKMSGSKAFVEGEGLAQAQRDHFEARFLIPFRSRLGYANLETGYLYSYYNLEDRGDLRAKNNTDRLTRGIGFFSVDLGTYFEKEVKWRNRQFIHSFEPRAYYLVQEYEDQSAIPIFDTTRFFYGYSQLFRRDRFSGIDRIADANELTLGITSTINNPQSGREVALFRLGKTSQFRDRKVLLDDFEINRELDEAFSGDISLVLNDRLRSVIGFVWNHKNREWSQSSFHMNYMGKEGEILNVGFRKLFAENINQSDVSLVWPLTNNASIFGRWGFDWNRNRTLDSFFGVQYDDCCLEVKFGYRKSLDIPASRYYALPQSDESILLQLNFKGFADFGSRVDSIMRQGIRGYADRK